MRIDTEPATEAKKLARIKRGLKWHKQVENPDVFEDPEKMVDVNHYLDSIKPKEKIKVKEKK